MFFHFKKGRGNCPAFFFSKQKIKIMYNALTKKQDYIGSMQAVDAMAIKANVKPEIIALQIIKENLPIVQQYVIEHGEKPEKDPIMLAAQATVLHEQKIWDKIENEGIPDYDSAENEVLAEEQAAEDKGEISNFLGSVLGVVFKAGAKALPKINEKRIKAGKKPILAGEKGQRLFNKINQHVQLEAINEAEREYYKSGESGFAKTDAGIFLGSLATEVERQKTMEAIKKYLPFIIIAIIAIIYFARKS